MDSLPPVVPFPPIFAVEVIDTDGFAWLYAPLNLEEALKISAYYEAAAEPGREPRITIPPALVGIGLDETDQPGSAKM